jgi:hypothetical protein
MCEESPSEAQTKGNHPQTENDTNRGLGLDVRLRLAAMFTKSAHDANRAAGYNRSAG